MATWSRVSLVLSAASLALLAGCTKPTPPPPDAPQVVTFSADKTRVAPGELVTLTFQTKNASVVELLDDSGAAIQLEGEVAQGTAKVAPGRTSFYVLRATGPGGRDAAFVQVAVDEPPRTVFLLSVPGAVDSGQPAQLVWSAFGATSATLASSLGPTVTLTGQSGTLDVSPARSAVYTLSANVGAGRPALTASTRVQVRPVVSSFTAAPRAAHAGDTITLSWKTAGADVVTVSEKQFGLLATQTAEADVDQGSFAFVVPAKLPNGLDVANGLPLRFELSASVKDPAFAVTRSIDASVGDGPALESATAPGFVSTGKTFALAWKTQRASKVTVLVGGLPLFETLPGDAVRVASGQVSLPAPSAATDYTVRASDDLGLADEKVVQVKPVELPVIDTFTLPASVTLAGDSATARWTTRHATRLHLRVEGSVNLATVTAPAQVTSGTAALLPGASCVIVLEAFNAAGDQATARKPITVGTPGATITPSPAIKGTPVTLTWNLPNGGVTEVVGLPGTAPVSAAASTNFVDLTNAPTARVLTFTDSNDGDALLTDLASFRFPLMGTMHEEFHASVNGALFFTTPGATTHDNTSLAADGGVAPQSVLAPFWDDLQMAATSQVLYDVQATGSGDRRLVVQWNHLEAIGDPGSDLTFQAQLSESGRVLFVYSSLLGATSPTGTPVAQGGSATIAIADPATGLVQNFSSNGVTALADGMEVSFLGGQPASGSVTFPALRNGWVGFTGVTSSNTVPVRVYLGAFAPGDVAVSEAMPQPDPAVAATGQWVELTNTLPTLVDLGGLTLRTPDSADGGFTFPSPTWVDGGGQYVVGQSLDLAETGGAKVDVVGFDLPLALDGGSVLLDLGASNLASLTWGVSKEKESAQPGARVLLSSGTFSCSRTVTFGDAGVLGTPAAPNEQCEPYVVQSIPGAFVDASGATLITLGGSTTTDAIYARTVLPVPFRYFGTVFDSVNVDVNGILGFGVPWTSGAWWSNASLPSSSNPVGVVAPFWDDLVLGTGNVYLLRQSDRTIISWHNVDLWTSSIDATLQFQVHLRDNGVIEFHYGQMTGTGSATGIPDRLTGNSATTWLESPDGTMAVPVNINTAGAILPYSGYRFTPKN